MLVYSLTVLLLLVIGYGFGCFSTGFIVGKAYGIDIRGEGSGNVGTTNAFRTLGKKAGFFTFLGDVFKSLIPALFVRLIVFSGNDEASYFFSLVIGLGVVLGHNFPFYLRFKGGKGIAVSGGVIIASTLNWKVVVFGLLFFIIIVAITKYVSLGSLIVVWYIPMFTVWIYRESPWFIAMLVASLLFVVFAYIKHWANIKRLLAGTENKIMSKKDKIVK